MNCSSRGRGGRVGGHFRGGGSMPEPIRFVVDDDPATLEALAAVLERRFGADYRIVADASPASALARIEQACERGEKVALVVASETSGPDWFVRVRDLCSGAGRCMLVGYADARAYAVSRRAIALGTAETFLLKPWGHPEGRLYPVVSEMLASWARTALPQPAVLRIVGERWSPRFVELRDLAARNSIACEFLAHDSAEGQRLLHVMGHTGRLPAVIFRNQVPGDPLSPQSAELPARAP